MTGVLAAAGYLYGQITGTGYDGLVFALVLSVGMTLISWYAGDTIALYTAGAQEITHEQAPQIFHLVENLAITSGIPTPKIYLVEDPSPNAFATGRDPKHASIALTSGLLERMDKNELEGVIAHELSHIKNEDTRFLVLVAVLVGAVTLLGHFFLRGSFRGKRDDRSGIGNLALLLGIILLVLSPLIGELIKLAVSRRREYLADASGALLTRYPEGLARALEKIRDINEPLQNAPQATAHLWISNPGGETSWQSWLSQLFSTHPPINDRIHQLRNMENAR